MVLTNAQYGLEGLLVDGIIGLSPVKFMSNDSELFIERAYETGAISNKQFSFSIG